MGSRLLVFGLSIAVAGTILVAPARSQQAGPPTLPVPPDHPAPSTPLVAPKGQLPRPPPGDRVKNLEYLFEALKVAPDEDSAKHVENRIWALWMVSGSDTVDLLMARSKAAVEADDYALALRLIDAVIELAPDHVEAWNRRATISFLRKDFGRSMADIREVLKREPRHFGAWSGLGMILQEVGDDRRALDAFRHALALHPRLERIPDLAKKLTEKVEGRGI